MIQYLLGCFAYRRDHVIYLNAFSGDATTEFPSTLQMARGGVCLKLAQTLIKYFFELYFYVLIVLPLSCI